MNADALIAAAAAALVYFSRRPAVAAVAAPQGAADTPQAFAFAPALAGGNDPLPPPDIASAPYAATSPSYPTRRIGGGGFDPDRDRGWDGDLGDVAPAPGVATALDGILGAVDAATMGLFGIGVDAVNAAARAMQGARNAAAEANAPAAPSPDGGISAREGRSGGGNTGGGSGLGSDGRDGSGRGPGHA